MHICSRKKAENIKKERKKECMWPKAINNV